MKIYYKDTKFYTTDNVANFRAMMEFHFRIPPVQIDN